MVCKCTLHDSSSIALLKMPMFGSSLKIGDLEEPMEEMDALIFGVQGTSFSWKLFCFTL